MIIPTHIQIGKIIYEHNSADFRKLNKMAFIYGNIKPDIHNSLRKKPHRMKDSLDFVVDLIDEIIHKSYKSKIRFSIDLGVINHFLADFFCRVHFYKQIPESQFIITHLKYEQELHHYFKSVKQADLLFTLDDYTQMTKSELKEALLQFAFQYANEHPQYSIDVAYALGINLYMTHYIAVHSVGVIIYSYPIEQRNE